MRVIAGPEKKTRVMSEKERRITAYHEMGHAIVGHFLPNSDPIHKISIISRGQALGYTISLPGEDKFLTTRAELQDTMAMTLGGRAAEEIVFGEITTGASNDLEKVTATAKQMVMRFGMSEKLGPRVFGHDHGQPFLGREFSSEPDYSDEIAREIDDEIRRIVETATRQAKRHPGASSARRSSRISRDPDQARDDRAATSSMALLDGDSRGAGLRLRGARSAGPSDAARARRRSAPARARGRCRGRASPAAPPSRPGRAVLEILRTSKQAKAGPLVLFVRWGIPLIFTIIGIVLIVLAHGHLTGVHDNMAESNVFTSTFTDRDSVLSAVGVASIVIALMFLLLSWMLRLNADEAGERADEDRAREHFTRTGHWPDER